MILRRPLPIASALLVAAALWFGSMAAATPVRAGAHENAKAFVNSVIEIGVRQLTGKDLSEAERHKRFLEFLYKYADSPNVEQSLVGHYWDKATPEQRDAYRKLLEDYLTMSYASGLTDYGPKEHIDVLAVEDRDGRTIVHTLDIDPASPPPSRVDWVLVTRADGFRVADVIFEGVSAVSMLRDGFTGTIRNAGGNFEALLTAMKAKIASYKTEHK
jgi:phospholipid transport system substrate-binding protein